MWVLLLAVLAGVVGGGYWFRADIMRALPATGQIYAAFGLLPRPGFEGLDLTEVTWKQEETADGDSVLRITGKVINRSESPKDVPELAGVLYDENNNALHSWTFETPEPRHLLPSEDVTFNTHVTNPDVKAARLTIRFNGGAAP